MTSQADLAVIRAAYAKQIALAAGSDDPRLVAALAALPREAFVPPGPWRIWAHDGVAATTPDDDPVYLYQDVVVPLLVEKGLNTGQPSFVARLIGLAAVRAGDAVVHVGTGMGYYTALLASLATPSGSVLGIEVEPELVQVATTRLAPFGNVEIREANGFATPLPAADAILVNAGTPRLAATWLDALKPGGRLVVPLAGRLRDGDRDVTQGIVFQIVRTATGFSARAVSGTMIYSCAGASTPDAEAALEAALKAGGAQHVTALVRGPPPKDHWLAGDDWALVRD